jgi:hypothetical protein
MMGMGLCRSIRRRAFMQMLFHRRLIKFIRLSLNDVDGILRAVAKAGPQSVAEVIGCQDRLAADDFYRSLCTGRHTEAAAITFFPVNQDDFSDHVFLLVTVGMLRSSLSCACA